MASDLIDHNEIDKPIWYDDDARDGFAFEFRFDRGARHKLECQSSGIRLDEPTLCARMYPSSHALRRPYISGTYNVFLP